MNSNLNKYKISIVGFLNTLPLRYGLASYSNLFDISEDIPSECANKLLTNKVDIGLIPVATLAEMDSYHILTDYCIGSKGKVDSVYLLSDVPLSDIKSIYLDYRSRTSINLCKILAKNFWEIEVDYLQAFTDYEKSIANNIAGVVIGDKALEIADNFKYKYDLAYEWEKYSGEEFVFAAWVSASKIPEHVIDALNMAMNYGVNHIEESISFAGIENNIQHLKRYLTDSIDYKWTSSKRRSLKKFMDELKNLEQD